jgi:hypothetical protein
MAHSGRHFVPPTLPAVETKATSRAAREREAKAYWDALTPAQEAWVLRKMHFAEMGKAAWIPAR